MIVLPQTLPAGGNPGAPPSLSANSDKGDSFAALLRRGGSEEGRWEAMAEDGMASGSSSALSPVLARLLAAAGMSAEDVASISDAVEQMDADVAQAAGLGEESAPAMPSDEDAAFLQSGLLRSLADLVEQLAALDQTSGTPLGDQLQTLSEQLSELQGQPAGLELEKNLRLLSEKFAGSTQQPGEALIDRVLQAALQAAVQSLQGDAKAASGSDTKASALPVVQADSAELALKHFERAVREALQAANQQGGQNTQRAEGRASQQQASVEPGTHQQLTAQQAAAAQVAARQASETAQQKLQERADTFVRALDAKQAQSDTHAGGRVAALQAAIGGGLAVDRQTTSAGLSLSGGEQGVSSFGELASSRNGAANMPSMKPEQAMQPQTPLPDQIAMRVRHAAANGQPRLTVQLHPAELGRVDVRLELSDDGMLRALITAERPEALDLLQRDIRGLERALSDAGLKTDSQSLQFDLREQGQQRARNGEHEGDSGNGGGAPGGTAADDGSNETGKSGEYVYSGLLNLSV